MTRRGTLGEPTNPTATVLLIPLVSYVGYRHPVADERDGKVLKIIITETPTEIRWVLQGRLFGPQVTEVKAYWSTANRILKGRSASWISKNSRSWTNVGEGCCAPCQEMARNS
jgi:hypothetical protein